MITQKIVTPVLLTYTQQEQGLQVLYKAFYDYALFKYIFPDTDERDRALPQLLQMLMHYRLKYGQVYTTPLTEGVATWLAPNNSRITLWRLIQSGALKLLFHMSLSALKRLYINEYYVAQILEPYTTQPHWLLCELAVDLAFQGQGIGGRLLSTVLVQADEAGQICCLETHMQNNLSFYRKYGFEVVDEAQIPNSELQVWGMVRQPKTYY